MACTVTEMQATAGCETGSVVFSQEGMQLAKPILRCSSANSDIRRGAVHGSSGHRFSRKNTDLEHFGILVHFSMDYLVMNSTFVVDNDTTAHGIHADTVALSPTVLIKCSHSH